MQLGSDWKKIIRHAWSVRLLAVAGFFSAAQVFFSADGLQDALGVSPTVFAAASTIATIGAFVSRLVVQKEIDGSDA